MKTHKERVRSVKDFAEGNKIFTIIASLVIIYLLFNFIFSQDETQEREATTDKPASETVEQIEDSNSEWRFYWLDFWILFIGGGFCSVMIIRQRKKAREELQ